MSGMKAERFRFVYRFTVDAQRRQNSFSRPFVGRVQFAFRAMMLFEL